MSKSPPTITEEEAEKLLATLRNEQGTKKQSVTGIRNHLIALLMLDAGLRVGEVVGLRRENLYFGGSPVHSLVLDPLIAEKHCERIVPTSQRIRLAIEAIQNRIWENSKDKLDPYAFCPLYGFAPLTTRQVERIIGKASMKGMGRHIHPHVLRHTFASRLMRTVNVRIIQELLGHKNISSTQIYTHPNHDDLKKAIESLGGQSHESKMS